MISNVTISIEGAHKDIGNVKIRALENMKPVVDKLISLGYTTSLRYTKRHIFVNSSSKVLTYTFPTDTEIFNEHKNTEISSEELLMISSNNLNDTRLKL